MRNKINASHMDLIKGPQKSGWDGGGGGNYIPAVCGTSNSYRIDLKCNHISLQPLKLAPEEREQEKQNELPR